MARRMVLAAMYAMAVVLATVNPASAQQRDVVRESEVSAGDVERWALLIGVNDYQRLADLTYCGSDVQSLRERLIQIGFPEDHVWSLTDGAESRYLPFKTNIERQLEIALKLAGANDVVLVAFSGHGWHADGQSYFCPTDTDLSKLETTTVSLQEVYRSLEACRARQKLLLVDACRNDPRPPGGKNGIPIGDGARGFSQALSAPPAGILLLASCVQGQISWEDAALQHGVFMHFLLNGLAGAADQNGGNNDRKVSILELYRFASSETRSFVANSKNSVQTPELYGSISGDWDLTPPLPAPQQAATEPAPVAPPPASRQRSSTPFADHLKPFGQVPAKWTLFGELADSHFEIERPNTWITGDFVLTVQANVAVRSGFRITLAGAEGAPDVALEGGKLNAWSGTDDWSFQTPKEQTRMGITPGPRLFTLRRQGQVFTFSVDRVFNPRSHSPIISTFVVPGSADFQTLRIATDGPGAEMQSVELK